MADGTIITNVTDVLAVCSKIIESAENEVLYISPPSLLILASQLSLTERTKAFIQGGGQMRGIADISYPYIGEIRYFLDNGVDVHHFHQYVGIFMLVGDEKESISTMTVNGENLSTDTPIVALWSDSPTYAEYLMSTFEMAWGQSIPAIQRIEELLKEGAQDI